MGNLNAGGGGHNFISVSGGAISDHTFPHQMYDKNVIYTPPLPPQ